MEDKIYDAIDIISFVLAVLTVAIMPADTKTGLVFLSATVLLMAFGDLLYRIW